MQFKCMTNTSYFSAQEREHNDFFLANEPQVGVVYTNSKGEKRHCLMVKYPKGIITNLTVYAPGFLPDGSRLYHTPCATIEDIKCSRVWYEQDGSWGICTSCEWLEWLGEKFKAKKKPEKPPNPQLKARGEMLKAQKEAKVTKKEYDELQEASKGDKPNWISPTKRKKK